MFVSAKRPCWWWRPSEPVWSCQDSWDSGSDSPRSELARRRPVTYSKHRRSPSSYYLFRMPLAFTRLRTPIGELVITASDTAITGVFFPPSRRARAPTARGVLRPHPHHIRLAARSPRLGVRASRVERAAPNSLRHHDELRGHRKAARRSCRHARRRTREWEKPDPDHCPVSSGRGIKGGTDGLRRRIGYETVAAGT